MPRLTRALVAASVLGGAVSLTVAAAGHPPAGHAGVAHWAIAGTVGLLLLASWVRPVVVYRGAESEAFNLDEGFFVMLALLVPPLVTLGTLGVATAVAQAIRRRQVVKSAFNTGQVLTAAGLGLVVSRAIAVPAGPLTAGQVAAAAAGVVVYFAINTTLVAAVMTSVGATWRECRRDMSAQAVLAGAGALVSLALAVAIRAHVWALALAVPALVVERWLISARFAALADRARMAGLYEVTLEANRGLRQQAVLETILRSARKLLRSPDASLATVPPALGEPAAPVTIGGKRRWLVAAGRRRDEPFGEADRGLLRALAAVGSGALANAELYQQVRLERERLSSITLSIGEGVCAVSADGKLTLVNQAAADMIELPSGSAAIGDPVSDGLAVAPDFLAGPAREAMRTGQTVREDDARFRGKRGGTIPVAYTASAVMSEGVPSGAVITFRDISERKALEDELHAHAFCDSLTGLANRRGLVERLDRALRRSALDRKTHALIFVDVDRFKNINDSLGHVAGDEVLVAIASRMKAVLRADDLLARFGGDEFVVLLENVAGVDMAVAAARRIGSAVKRPIVLPGGCELVASLSVGIALTEPGKSADDVLHDADVAMYEAKAKGGGGAYKVFNQACMAPRSSQWLQTEADLRKGLERDEFEVHFQPFFSLREQRVVGAEALVRWRHPSRGLMSPLEFIPMAEQTGLILPIGRYVLDQVCQRIRAVQDGLGVDLPISVNLSPRQFQESWLLPWVSSAIEESGLPAQLFVFEITESMVMNDLAGARELMRKLTGLGARLSVDDFGTGHSSLAYLKQFPVHEVKVDRTFVAGVAENQVDSAIVRAIIDLAGAMGIAAVAEGVESRDQARRLRALGCQVGQGFYFSPPVRAEDFDTLLARRFAPAPDPVVRLPARTVAGAAPRPQVLQASPTRPAAARRRTTGTS